LRWRFPACNTAGTVEWEAFSSRNGATAIAIRCTWHLETLQLYAAVAAEMLNSSEMSGRFEISYMFTCGSVT